MTHTSAAELRGLGKTYRSFWRRPHVALAELDLTIETGQIFGLLGPNGSGKTTTMRLILGLLRPTVGEVRVFGRSPADPALCSELGFLPEDSPLFEFLTCFETLDHLAAVSGIPRKERRRRAEELLDRFGLRRARDRRVHALSKGMARRLGLAQALIHRPRFLLLDEPTSGLDPVGIQDVLDLLRELRAQSVTVLLSSHQLFEIESVCDRIGILRDGHLLLEGSVDSLLVDSDASEWRVTGEADALRRAEDAARAAGVSSLESSPAKRSLESLYRQTIQADREES
ncbi:MAG: ABC transporter ATP-binding protein [Planctomycetota bacterium]